MYKKDLALNNAWWLTCRETKQKNKLYKCVKIICI